jgi:dTDP-4-amino-4,6-dideoxygalactose transaminase
VPGARAKLEAEFAAKFGFGGAVATGFGRAALALGLEALEVAGGEVAIPNFVCEQVPAAVRHVGAEPRFFSVTRDLSVPPAEFSAALTSRTRAAVLVHYFGRALPQLETLAQLCRERGIPLVEDCALALGAEGAGRTGEMAVYSFTKSDWCYGGGLVAARSPNLIERLQILRDARLRPARALAFSYGLLRRLDFASNRPRWARLAEWCGPMMQALAPQIPRGADFYEAGRYDAAMPEFAAQRARRILASLEEVRARRTELIQRICNRLHRSSLLFHSESAQSGSSAFLVLKCEKAEAEALRQRAALAGVTLRRVWPAYQEAQAGQGSEDLEWLAHHLLGLEIHPLLSAVEADRMAEILLRCRKNHAG